MVKPRKTLVKSCFRLTFSCKGRNFKQPGLGLNKTRGPLWSRKVNMGAAAEMKAPVILWQKNQGGHKSFTTVLQGPLTWEPCRGETETMGLKYWKACQWFIVCSECLGQWKEGSRSVLRCLQRDSPLFAWHWLENIKQLASAGWLQSEKKGSKRWSHHTIKPAFLPLR